MGSDIKKILMSNNLAFKNIDALQNEISCLSSSYKNVNITSKDDSLLLIVQPFPEHNIYVKFQIYPEYPQQLPNISITSDCLTKTETSNLHMVLERKAKGLHSHAMLVDLLGETCKYLSQTVHSGVIFNGSTTSAIKQGSHSSGKKELNKNFKNSSQKREKKKTKPPTSKYAEDNNFTMVSHPITRVCNSESDSMAKRPTHFIALRLTDAIVIENLLKVQSQLVRKEPLLTKGAFSKNIFHITLCYLGLDTDEEVTYCVDILKKLKPDLQNVLPHSPLVIYGMSQFYNRTIYAKVKHDNHFLEFDNILKEKLKSNGVELQEDHEDFNPHVTIIKVKRPERKLFGTKNIEPSLYSHVLDSVFGEQMIDTLYLCSTGGQRRMDGFYMTLCELKFR